MKDNYIKPKIGDVVICIDDDSQDEDFGVSGIVLPGTKGLKINEEYTITFLDFDNVPKSRFDQYKNPIWTPKQFNQVRWYWTFAWVKNQRSALEIRINLGKFKRK